MKVAQKMSILLWLRTSKKDLTGFSTVMVRITIDGKRTEWSLGRKVNPNHWITGAGMLKPGAKEANVVNNYLNQVRGQLQQIFNLLTAQNQIITPEMVRDTFLGVDKDEKRQKKTILDAFEYHNAKFKEKVDVGKGSKKTHTRLQITKNKVIAFMQDVLKVKDKPLEELKLSFATEFEHYLSVKHKLQTNTSMKYVKIVKQIMNFAVGLEWISVNPFLQFKCSYSNPEREVLTQLEIDLLYSKRMPNKRLEQVRDVFIFACYTGFAFADIEKLESNAVVKGIDGEYWIQTSRVKTNAAENVMLLDIPLEIIEKYKYDEGCKIKNRLLPVISNQRYNSYLKEIADISNINKNLTSHIARHTFATTVTLANGVSLESVSALLGHKSIRTTQIYAKVAQTKLSSEMKQLKAKFKIVDVPKAANS